MARFRSRPAEIRAVQWTGDNLDEIRALVGVDPDDPADQPYTLDNNDRVAVVVTTAQGQQVPAAPGEWIVPEAKIGRAYPIDPDVFDARWAPFDDPMPVGTATEPASHILTGWRADVAGGEQTVRVDLRDRDAALASAPDVIPALASLDLLHAEALRDELTNTLATAKAVSGLAPLVVAAGGNAQSFAEELTRKVASRSVGEALGALAGFGGRRGGGLFG